MVLHAEAGSTNRLAAADPRPGTVVVADHQHAGRGRLDRTWETPPGTALTFSVVVDPGMPDARWPLLPLVAGLAVAGGLARLDPARLGTAVGLKWPNDVLIGEDKVAGILLERVSARRPVAVIGIGVNVAMAADQLPVPTATSLALAGVAVPREDVLGAVLETLSRTLSQVRADPSAVLAEYRRRCVTLGREVNVQLPAGEGLTGTAESVDEEGRLVVSGTAVGAGDVVHVRPT